MDPSKNKDSFIQEYAYIEDIPLQPIEEDKTKTKDKDEERGVYILDLFSDD